MHGHGMDRLMDGQRAAFLPPRSSAQVLLEVTSLVRTHRVKVTAQL